jgi:hypothetical protein
MTRRKIEYWVILPEADGEFVATMEEVLETYAQPYDARRPVLCSLHGIVLECVKSATQERREAMRSHAERGNEVAA